MSNSRDGKDQLFIRNAFVSKDFVVERLLIPLLDRNQYSPTINLPRGTLITASIATTKLEYHDIGLSTDFRQQNVDVIACNVFIFIFNCLYWYRY